MFNQSTIEALGFYVYSLTDPRTNKVFYIGKGNSQRVFAHVADAEKTDRCTDKLDLIREIHAEGLEVEYTIIRHGLETEAMAYEVESALISVHPDLTNAVKGHGADRGPASVEELNIRYGAELADLNGLKVMMIKINNTYGKIPTFDATRFSWKVRSIMTNQADVVLGVAHGIVRGVYVASEWIHSNPHDEPELYKFHGIKNMEKEMKRKVMVGTEAPQELQERFLNKMVPAEYSVKGSMASVRYNYR